MPIERIIVPESGESDAASAPGAARGAVAARGMSLNGYLAVALTLAGVLLIDAFIVSGGNLANWGESTAYHSLLADGFLHGQTSLMIRPDPRLVAAKNPYDWNAHPNWGIWDMTLFQGKYYLYFGPAPALICAAIKYARADSAAMVYDHLLSFLFVAGLTIAGTLTLIAARAKFYAYQPLWTVLIGVMLLGCALPVTWCLCHGTYLEASICGGQCFYLAGMGAGLLALSGRRPWTGAITAGICWMLAIASRLSLAPCVCVTFILFAVGMLSRGDSVRGRAGAVLLGGLPLAGGIIALAVYNAARFGAWSETGWVYQLSSLNHLAMRQAGLLTSSRYMFPHVLRYLLEYPELSGDFPYIGLHDSAHGILGGLGAPGLILEQVGGIAWSVPVLVFGLFVMWRRESSPLACKVPPPTSGCRWLCSSLGFTALCGLLPTTITLFSTERYLADSVPSALLLAVLGFWRLRQAVQTHARRLAITLTFVMLAGVTLLCGLLPPLGDNGRLPQNNPGLYHFLVDRLSF